MSGPGLGPFPLSPWGSVWFGFAILPFRHRQTWAAELFSGVSEQKEPAGSQSVINTQGITNTSGLLDVLSKNILEAGGCTGM